MNEKNWREKAFILGMIGAITWAVLPLIAMISLSVNPKKYLLYYEVT